MAKRKLVDPDCADAFPDHCPRCGAMYESTKIYTTCIEINGVKIPVLNAGFSRPVCDCSGRQITDHRKALSN